MPPIDEPAPAKGHAREGRRSKAAVSRADLVAITIDAVTGRLVRIEHVDDAGARREVSGEDRSLLAATGPGGTVQSLVEQAFEAGVACGLGDSAAAVEPATSDDEAELIRLLLASLIAHSPAQPLLQGEVVRRAIVATLLEDAANGRGGPPEGAVAH